MDRIPMENLEEGRAYRIRSRNLMVGVWRARTRGFIGIREKFGSTYLFEEYHYDADPHLGTVNGMEPMDAVVPEGMELSERNDDLYEWLIEVEKPVLAAYQAERLAEEAVRDLKAFSPMTLQEYEREQRHERARRWMREQRELGELSWMEITEGMVERMRKPK